MNSSLRNFVLALLGTLVFFVLIIVIGGAINPDLKLDQTALLRFVFVAIGFLIVIAVYWVTRDNKMWARVR
jgi:archaellum biogenesis protein FlaJ (TadC family)